MPNIVETLDDSFLAHLNNLTSYNAANADAVCIGEQRKWYMPPDSSWSGDLLDILGTNAAFDRSALNTSYVDVVTSPSRLGAVGEAMVVKLQLDYIATLERSFRTRHATSVRCKIHAAARRRGHAASGGLFDTSNGNLAIWLEKMLTAAHYVPPS